MQIYLFFKKYYIKLGYNLAIYLGNKGITPNQASVLSLVIIIPLFIIITSGIIINDIIFLILFIIAFNIKLILNAIDGIIAREKNINTKLGMFLNVGTDIGPDILIFLLLVQQLGLFKIVGFVVAIIMILYLLLEFIFIKKYNKQNMFMGKDIRVGFFILIFTYYFLLPIQLVYILIYYYLFALILHNVGFFIPKYRN